MKKILLIFIYALVLLINNESSIYCQSVNPFVIASAGGNFVSANTQLTWTLGEVVISTLTNGNIILTQGFQQNTYIINSIGEIADNSFNFSVYPNPTSSLIRINWQNTEEDLYIINITNNNGICVLKKTVNFLENQTELDLNSLPNSIYILTVNKASGKNMKTFKIVKI